MGLYLTKPNLERNSGMEEHPMFKVAHSQIQGWKIQQEEILIIKPHFDGNNSLFAVLEMCGGDDIGKYVESNMVEMLINEQEYQKKNYDKAIKNVFESMDNKLREQFDGKVTYQGTTMLLTLITDENVYVANIGLARCVVRYENKAKVMSVDHYPLNDVEKQRILAAGGEVWENRLNAHLPFTRAFGNFEYKCNSNLDVSKQLMISVPSLKWVDIKSTSMVLMGSHGFWQNWTNSGISDVIVERVDQNKTLQEIIDAIVDSIVAPNVESEHGKDNISCIIVLINK